MELATRLGELTTHEGFRQRGLQMTRIETFTDAAFAFALTLLVVSLELPTSYEELMEALRGAPAFALSAALLMMFWSGHRIWSRRFGLDDGPTVLLSCLLVFTVLIYVYPLRFMFSSMVAWLSYISGLQQASGQIFVDEEQVNSLFVVYGIGFIAMCAAIVLLNLHAWRLRDQLQLNELERFDTRVEITAWLLVASSGFLSVALALLLPVTWVGIPGWSYALLSIVMPIYGSRSGRRRRELLAAAKIQ